MRNNKSKDRKNQEEVDKGKSKAKEQNYPLAEEENNISDQEAGGCLYDLGVEFLLFLAIHLLICELLMLLSSY